jgi:hypothetical protein
MRTRNWIIIAGATLALIAAFALPSLSWARGPDGGTGRGPGAGMMGGMGRQDQSLVAVTAQVLGIPQADLVAQLQSGKSIKDVAGDKIGVVVNTFVTARVAQMDALVASGRLTRAEADQRIATMTTNVAARISEPWAARGPGGGAGPTDQNGDGVCDQMGTGMGPGTGAGMGHGRMGTGRGGQ